MIVLPWPPHALSPNARPHFYTKAAATKKARAWAFAATRDARIGVAAADVPILLAVTFHPKTRHPIDQDNAMASCKAYFDGIADALKVNDHLFRFASVEVAEPVKGGKVTVEIITGEARPFGEIAAEVVERLRPDTLEDAA